MRAKKFLLEPRLRIQNEKGQGISINMLIIIALAVFAIFLVLGFVSGGWSYFAGAFGGVTKGTGGYDQAKINCDSWCVSYKNVNCPTDTSHYLYKKLHDDHFFTTDVNGDGDPSNDCYNCLESVSDTECTGETIGNVLFSCKC